MRIVPPHHPSPRASFDTGRQRSHHRHAGRCPRGKTHQPNTNAQRLIVVMDRIQRFLAWYLGLKAPAPGEGTQWRLDWRSPGPSWSIALVIGTLLIVVTWIYRRDGESLGRWQRLTLTLLRLLVFVVISAAVMTKKADSECHKKNTNSKWRCLIGNHGHIEQIIGRS